jgi:hypothetical protein
MGESQNQVPCVLAAHCVTCGRPLFCGKIYKAGGGVRFEPALCPGGHEIVGVTVTVRGEPRTCGN